MDWIIDFNREIAVDTSQIAARSAYIQQITEADVSPWQPINLSGETRFLICTSSDSIDGVFITAHNHDVFDLCSLPQIYAHNMIIANTCVWARFSHKGLLWQLRRNNPEADLYYAKQELSVDDNKILRHSTTLAEIGAFGFQTSLSERELFSNRKKGLKQALKSAFVKVSPLLLIGE